MTTATDIIQDALLAGGIGDIYNAPDANLLSLGLRFLNRMMDQWSAEFTPLFNIIDGYTGAPTPGWNLTPGTAAYTIGTAGGQMLGVRPTEIAEIYLLDGNNVSYYLVPITADEFARLVYKVAPGRPDRYYPNFNETTIQLTFYPTPAYSDQVHCMYQDRMQLFGNGSTAVNLPPGYEEALVYNLALRLLPALGKQVPPDVAARAGWSKGIITEANTNTYMLQNPMPTMKRRFFNILTGGTV
jgi:hypothetical protein